MSLRFARLVPLFAFSSVAFATDSHIFDLFHIHADCLDKAVSLVRDAIPASLLDMHIAPFAAKQLGCNIPARELTLVDASLSMVDALKSALSLDFPMRQSKLDVVLKATVATVAHCGVDIVNKRAANRLVLLSASLLVAPLNFALRELVSDFGKPIAGHINFALVEVLVRAVGWRHTSLVHDLVKGFNPIGDIRSTSCLRPVEEPPSPHITRDSNLKSFDDAVQHLSRKAKQNCSDALKDQWEVWSKSLQECHEQFCVGPLSRGQVESLFKDTEFGPRCIPAFGIYQKGKLRRIDDACRSGHNLLTRMHETIVCVSADLPADIAHEFYKFLSFDVRLRLGTDDIASAYRVLLSGAPQYNIAAVWHPQEPDGRGGRVEYFALRGFNFGLKSAPVHLATLMRPLVEFARKIGLVACDQFYDDVLVVDPIFGGDSAQRTLEYIFRLIGFPFAPKKHERLRDANAFLGVVTDLSCAAAGYLILRVKEKRRLKLLEELKDIKAKNKLSPAHAARIRGKLYFTTTSAFFGVGRPALHAFTHRQYSDNRNSALNANLLSSIDFFIELLQNLPSQRIPLRDSDIKPLYIWSDAMWELHKSEDGCVATAVDTESGETFYIADAAIAFVVFDPMDQTWHTCFANVDRDVIRMMVPGKKTYIGQLEVLAATAVLSSMPTDRLFGRNSLFWIDNLAAKYSLQKGYSKVDDSGRIINAFKVMQAKLRMSFHFEYVPSLQNLADLPSRNGFAKMCEVIQAATGVQMVLDGPGKNLFQYDFVLPKFSTWAEPLADLPRKRQSRSGSRGSKRSKA